MKNTKFGLIVLFVIALIGCKSNNSEVKTTAHTDANGYSYETVSNDPTGLRLYTLDNGLKVYLSQNSDEPKIQTYIAVRAGSNYDPKESTGLAHYLEHMVFKGTSKVGTLDWEKEKSYLDHVAFCVADFSCFLSCPNPNGFSKNIPTTTTATVENIQIFLLLI